MIRHFRILSKVVLSTIPFVFALFALRGPYWTPLNENATARIRGGGLTYDEVIQTNCDLYNYHACGDLRCAFTATFDPEHPEGVWHYWCTNGPGIEEPYGLFAQCQIAGLNSPYKQIDTTTQITCWKVVECATEIDTSCGPPEPGHPEWAYCLNSDEDPFENPEYESTCSGTPSEE
jgi:hypothetical protein